MNSIIDGLISTARQSEALREVRIIRAYPATIKPTLMDRVLITLSAGARSGESVGIGEPVFYGRRDVDVDIFVPHGRRAEEANSVLAAFLSACVDDRVHRISVDRMDSSNVLGCYTLRCTLTYCDNIDFGDDTDG